MEDLFSKREDYLENENDDFEEEEYDPDRDDYIGEIIHPPTLKKSVFNEHEQVITFTVRSQNSRLAFGKTQLITETGDIYPVTITAIGNIQPDLEALRSGNVTVHDQVASIRSSDLPIELAQKARRVRQYRGPVKKEE